DRREIRVIPRDINVLDDDRRIIGKSAIWIVCAKKQGRIRYRVFALRDSTKRRAERQQAYPDDMRKGPLGSANPELVTHHDTLPCKLKLAIENACPLMNGSKKNQARMTRPNTALSRSRHCVGARKQGIL